MSDLHSLFPELGRWGTAGAVGAREHTEAGQRRGELGPAWWGATSRRCRFRCGRRSRCAVGLVEVEVFRWRPAGTRSAVRSPVPSPAKSPPTQAGIPFQPPEPIPHGGTAIDGAAAMTLVQVKRPYRRPDTAEVIPTVTREVDDEGATKPVEVMMRGQGRGPNSPSAGPGSNESGRHRSDHGVWGTAPRTRGTTTTRRLPGLEAGHPLGDPHHELVAPARRRSAEPHRDLPDHLSGQGPAAAEDEQPRGWTCVVHERPWGRARPGARQRRRESRRAPTDAPAPGTARRRQPLRVRPKVTQPGLARRPLITRKKETRPDSRQSETADESACAGGLPLAVPSPRLEGGCGGRDL